MPRFEVPKTRPVGELFVSSTDWWHNAVLTNYQPAWPLYAEGYRQAADILSGNAVADRRMAHILVYPIIFLYRQYLELGLKEIILYVEEIAEIEDKPPVGHWLDKLWSRFARGFRTVTDGSLDAEVEVLRNCVHQFAFIDPTSEAFRYPVNRDGLAMEHPVPSLDLRVLQDAMRKAGIAMDMVSGGLSVLVDLHRDYLADMAP